MNKEKKKTSINISKLVKQVKKEHFIKLILQISTILLLLIWVSMVLATSISGGIEYDYLYSADEKEGYKQVQTIWIKAIPLKDFNPLCIIMTETGWWFAILLSPIGFLSLLTYISIQKNMITPQAIKKTVRKALQFNYLKQKDVEYISDEIDYNIGIKERVKDEEDEEDEEE